MEQLQTEFWNACTPCTICAVGVQSRAQEWLGTTGAYENNIPSVILPEHVAQLMRDREQAATSEAIITNPAQLVTMASRSGSLAPTRPPGLPMPSGAHSAIHLAKGKHDNNRAGPTKPDNSHGQAVIGAQDGAAVDGIRGAARAGHGEPNHLIISNPQSQVDLLGKVSSGLCLQSQSSLYLSLLHLARLAACLLDLSNGPLHLSSTSYRKLHMSTV